MLSAANISHGIMVAIVMLISIVFLIGAGISALCRMKSKKNKSETNDMIILMVTLLGVAGLLFSCAG
ncbi:hypothetical protein GCM10025882_07080 [Acinetobacter gyllenbergii]|uniref:Uncharacterized protein n=1 Tax=Acinetobacter gyllenbergii CIP 110306 = MTCC 11365 TaxID=1217657 RepID=A0A829HP23_9GAMM|nr:hypothetical protein [Acinetobacter gyllenbergii]EPF93227.1 hypothetical protein F957_00313 [Acinetobacter gyllenbergii CIP 110306 = MTCC 11365]ESK36998.1 hypothetical protein F987_03457 [Acinetobacter gyllenbergii NIPH 230]OBY74178.1 hypothetical protein NG55_10055 [Acinetobacter gyllenbergii]GMA10284.1 hypothetical protein GCM10025882_07080 [Acinetobacter gyllenbergii]